MRGRVALLVNPVSHPPDASSLETVGVRLRDFVLPPLAAAAFRFHSTGFPN